MRKMFLGGITPQGFHSFYQDILGTPTKKKFILKGGPGTGKSTLLQRIGQKAQAKGWNCEYYYCSSDPDSLDGIALPDLQIAVVDGTAPHVQEARLPGAVEELVNLGECWETEQLEQQSENLNKLEQAKAGLFEKAIAYLRLTQGFYEQERIYYRDCGALDQNRLENLAQRLAKEYLLKTSGSASCRKLFGEVLTYKGLVNYLPSIMDSLPTRIIITGERGTGKSFLLSRLLETALQRGLKAEAFYSIWNPAELEHLIIGEEQIGFITSTPEHFYAPKVGDQVWDLNDFLLPVIPMADKNAGRELGRQTLAWAIEFLRQAREKHLLMEAIYTPAMNFAALEQKIAEIWAKIEAKGY